jgi:hypothetical protein
MPKLIISDEWIRQIALSQGINYNRVSRIIIDATVGRPVVMHIEQYGDAGILDLKPPRVVPTTLEAAE